MKNLKSTEKSFYFGRVNPSSVENEPHDIFSDWKVIFRRINLNEFECEIVSFNLSFTYRTPVIQSENELNEELALKYLTDNCNKIHRFAGIRDKNLGYEIDTLSPFYKNSEEFGEYMKGYNSAKLIGGYDAS